MRWPVDWNPSRAGAWGVCALGWATAGLGLWQALASPAAVSALPWGLWTPVIALELATTASDLEPLFGPVGSGSTESAWLHVHRIDFAFMTAYCALLAGRAVQVGGRWVRSIAVLAVGVWLADVVETVKLVDLTLTWSMYAPSDARIFPLPVATWTKWLGLGLALALLGRAQGGWRQGLFALPLLAGLGAFAYPPWLAEIMALCVAAAFVVLIADATRLAIGSRSLANAR